MTGRFVHKVTACILLLFSLASLSPAFAEGWYEEEWDWIWGWGWGSADAELLGEGEMPIILDPNSGDIGANVSSGLNKKLITELEKQTKRINVQEYALTPKQFYDAWTDLLNRHPELFYVSGGYMYYVTTNGCIHSILPTYLYSGTDLKQRQEAYNAELKKIVAYARQADTDIGRILRVNDYLCVNYEYDETYSIYSADKLFSQKTGVCQAYTLAFTAAMNELDITSSTIVSPHMNHCWNVVQLNGEWYHIDTTWNDPTPDRPLCVRHANVLRSDSGINGTGHYGWEEVVTASSTKYDKAFWIRQNTVLPMEGDTVYYVDQDFSGSNRDVYAWDIERNTTKKVFSYTYTSGSSYVGYSPIWVTDTDYYYEVRNLLYRMPRSSGSAVAVYDTGSSSLQIYSMYAEDNYLQMWCAASPSKSGSTDFYYMEEMPTLSLEETQVEMLSGTELQLTAASNSEIVWSSTDDGVVQVSGGGLLTAVGPGTAVITASVGDTLSQSCLVIVHSEEVLTLPGCLTTVEAEAFCAINASEIILQEGVESLAARAFADCGLLKLVQIPDSLEQISPDAFDGCEGVVLLCHDGAYGVAYAAENGLDCVIIN